MTTDRVAGAALALLAVLVMWESRRLPLGTFHNPGPAYVPALLALLLLGFGTVIFFRGSLAPMLAEVGWSEWRHAVAILGACAFTALVLERLGYRLTMAIAMLFLVAVIEKKNLVLSVVFAVAMAWGTYFVFDTVLRVQLPRGPFLGL
ncbi:MAG: tripartite tricarboxylate transporter TctB family protein [Candidatus Rokubacteria bacterium]|nr:tripartite tricarboxylate transporter TctB family protein [Candidatus Rokubacteria bacterium]